MNTNYQTALNHVLKSEGLWSDNPQDPGGATMKGITLAVYREWKRNQYITKDELKAIPDQDVYDLYKQLYWDKCHCDNMPSGIDYCVFDASVNMGCGRAAKLIQEAVNVTADGIIGSGTMASIQSANVLDTIAKFSELKENFYRSLKTFDTFGKGWLNRVAEVKSIATSMV